MVSRAARPFRSANAGEFSRDVKGRIDIKQYYSAGLAFKNIEPVPQSGFRQMGGTWKIGRFRRQIAQLAITSPSLSGGPHTGTATIWTGTIDTLALCAIAVEGLEISDGTATFIVEAQGASGWTAIAAGPFTCSAERPVNRLAAFRPGRDFAATAVRIRATFSESSSVTIDSVRAFVEFGTVQNPRYCDLTTDDGDVVMCSVFAGIADFWNTFGYQGSVLTEDVSPAMLADLDDYGEANTIGLFHGQLETLRFTLAGELYDWNWDAWPYDPVPQADLGGVYATVDDIWEMILRWTGPGGLNLSFTVNGETTTSLPLTDASDVPSAIADTDWDVTAASFAAAIEALAGVGPTVSVTQQSAGTNARSFRFTFGGALSGDEFDFSAQVTNTADASALPYHVQVGMTEKEDVFSPTRGWPGGVTLAQDRQALYRIPALKGAVALSRTGEYFDFNVAGRTDDAARLDRLRSNTSEVVLAVKESKYLLTFTDRGLYFATSRVIDRNTPLNFVQASEIGIQPNCRPFDLEGVVYYVAINPKGMKDYMAGGNQLLSAVYDDVSTAYNADPKSLLASHLVSGIIRTARQKPATDQDAGKGWLMGADGRLIAAQIIKNQDISGFCEWRAADQGKVREIRCDGENRLWLAVRRTNAMTHELYDPDIFLQDAQLAAADMTGVVASLDYPDGTQVWAVPPGFDYGLGPYVVTAGRITMPDYYAGSIIVGRWQAPFFENMPEVLVTQGDDVVIRPGRIHSADINVIDTTSIAVGANGTPARDVPLIDMTDQADQPIPPKTKKLQVTGMPGMVEYPTLVITQTRPGRLRVRDYAVTAKL